jgi:hypothetical protein
MKNRVEKLAHKISDAIVELAERDADNLETEQLIREAEVQGRGQTRIEGQFSGRRNWDGFCIGSVEFCTNGPQGGSEGHGGFLRVAFRNIASTSMEVEVDDATPERADKIAITFRGDAEIIACIESLEFLAAKLRAAAELW